MEWIAFHVTDRCQLDCDHCLRDPQKKPKDIDVDLVARVLDQARELYKVAHVTFTGGEPCLHPRFAALIELAVVRGCTWNFVSNGRRFDDIVRLLAEHPEWREQFTGATFSLDGASELIHDGIRGEGSYRDVMRAISHCVAIGLPFALQMVVHAKNEHEIEAMGLLASELGANKLSIGMMQPTGTFHDGELYLSAEGWKRVRERVERLRSMLKLSVIVPEGFDREQPFTTCMPFRSEQLHIDVDGRLNLCCQHSGIPGSGRTDTAGNLNDMPLVEAHGNLLEIIHQAQVRQLRSLASKNLSEWDYFPCNRCLKDFGKPHWTEAGVGGPAAQRERWRGAWEPRRLPVVV